MWILLLEHRTLGHIVCVWPAATRSPSLADRLVAALLDDAGLGPDMRRRSPPRWVLLAWSIAACATPGPLPIDVPAPMATLPPERTFERVPVRFGRAVLYYEIGGDTPEELHRQLDTARPDLGDERWDAYTRWKARWTFAREQQGDRCRVSGARVELNLTFILPRWVPRTQPTEELEGRWRRFMAALVAHEEGHARVGLACAEELAGALARVPETGDCPSLDAYVDAEARRIIDRHGAEDAQYERATRHGATQGVRRP